MTKQEKISEISTTGKMSWDDLIDYFYYKKTQCKIETIRYNAAVATKQGVKD